MSKEEIQQNQRDIDLLSRGLEILRFFESDAPTQHIWQKNGVLFLKKSDPKSMQRMHLVRTNDLKNISEWAMGKGLVAGVGLRSFVDEAMSLDEEERRNVAALLPSSVAKIQEDLQNQAGKLDISKFAAKKDVMKIITQLDSALQTGLLILIPKNTSKGQGGEISQQKQILEEEATNVYAKQFRDISFYSHFFATQTNVEDLDEFGNAVLKWLTEDWQKNVGEASSDSKEIQSLIEGTKQWFLKIAFEGRQLYRTRPLQTHLGLIYPLFKKSLAESLTLRKKVKEVLDFKSRDISKDQNLYLRNAHQHLQKATEEVESFLAGLPRNIKEAEKYYSEFRLALPNRLSPNPRKPEKKKKQKKKGDTFLSGVNWPLTLLTAFMLSIFIYLNWDIVSKRIFFWISPTVGSEFGVISSKLDDDRWIGTVDPIRWDRIESKKKLQAGLVFIEHLEKSGLVEMVLVDPSNNLLANTIYFNNKLTWRVEGLGTLLDLENNELKSYLPK